MTDPWARVAGVEHRDVEVGGVRFHVVEAGQGPPLVLLHGWPQSAFLWRHLIPHLAPHRRVLAPDLRGFGRSDAPPTGYDKEQLATDVLGVLDALGVERFGLAGHDWGGWVGFLLCLREPERVERYLALNIPHPFQKASVGGLRDLPRFWYQAVIGAPGLGPALMRSGWFVRRALVSASRHHTWTDEELEHYAGQFRDPARARASVLVYRTFLTRELPAVMGGRYRDQRLTVPTRLVFGVEDVAISTRMLRGHEGHADDLEIELVPECGHFIVEDRPDLVRDRALSWLVPEHAARA